MSVQTERLNFERVTDMLNLLNQKNSDFEIFSVDSEKFASFGKVIKTINANELIETAKKIPLPAEGSSYQASVEEFEALPVAKEIENELYGTLPTQIGYCWGHSNFLNATEWHTTSEVNIAITPLVLFLGHVWDVVDGKIDSSKFTAFYVPQGTVIEVFATTLHFCPCEVSSDGFGCIVALPKGTNTDLETRPDDKKIFRQNKWIIAHEDNQALLNRGVLSGITGENYELKY